MSGVEYCEGDIRWLSPDDLVDVNTLVIRVFTPDEPCGLRDRGLLEGAQNRPSQYRYYQRTNDMPTLAAVLLESIARVHAFHNGNKRTAFISAVMFMRMNGYQFNPPLVEALEICEGCVLGRYTVGQVAYWIASHSQPSDSAVLVSDLLHIVFEYNKTR